MSPTAADFAALARSSPWLWSTLRFTCEERKGQGDGQRPQQPVRARLRRPDRLRVEDLDGGLRQIVVDPVGTGSVAFDPPSARPVRNDDGLVVQRPGGLAARMNYDAPMYQNYFWVAILDPIELADGRGADGHSVIPGTDVTEVREVDDRGRPAWQALLRPTDGYEPRCGCCSMLRSRRIDVDEWGEDRTDVLLTDYPSAYRVRLDRDTGVCTYTEALDGDIAGGGHELRIEAVDEPLGDELFRDAR